MLTKHPALAGKIVKAWTEDAFREIQHEKADPTYDKAGNVQFLVDEGDRVLGAVSDEYTLVENAELLSAVDIAVDKLGMSVFPVEKHSFYHNGRSKYELRVPEINYKIGKDPSPTEATIILRNDYRGNGGLKIETGVFRVICTNGLRIGKISYRANVRHVGDIDLLEFVGRGINHVHAEAEIARLLGEQFAAVPVDRRQVLSDGADGMVTSPQVIRATLAPRYQEDFDRAVRENVREIGDNQWAVIQAVAELATHRMQTTAKGLERANYNAAADDWAARMVDVIRTQFVEV